MKKTKSMKKKKITKMMKKKGIIKMMKTLKKKLTKINKIGSKQMKAKNPKKIS